MSNCKKFPDTFCYCEHCCTDGDCLRARDGGYQRPAPVAEEKTTGGRPFGCALATAVLQSDEYRRLDDEARAECDELIERWKRWLKPRSDGPHGSQDV